MGSQGQQQGLWAWGTGGGAHRGPQRGVGGGAGAGAGGEGGPARSSGQWWYGARCAGTAIYICCRTETRGEEGAEKRARLDWTGCTPGALNTRQPGAAAAREEAGRRRGGWRNQGRLEAKAPNCH